MLALDSVHVRRYAGWSAYLSAGFTIIGTVFLFLFYALEVPRATATSGSASYVWGTLNDLAVVFQLLFMLPLTMALQQLIIPRHQSLSWVALALGVVGILTAAIAQILLIARVISFEVNLPLGVAALGLIGAWMVVVNHLGRAGGILPARLAWLGEIMGAVFVLMGGLAPLLAMISSFGAFVQQHPVIIGAVIALAVPGFLAYFVGLPVWLVGLGRRLLTTTSAPERGKRQLVQAERLVPGDEDMQHLALRNES